MQMAPTNWQQQQQQQQQAPPPPPQQQQQVPARATLIRAQCYSLQRHATSAATATQALHGAAGARYCVRCYSLLIDKAPKGGARWHRTIVEVNASSAMIEHGNGDHAGQRRQLIKRMIGWFRSLS
jgi:hypothetical protein